MTTSKMMAIAAHPGDAIFTMGAAVAQHIPDGGSGVFVSLSLGEKGAPRNIPVTEYGEKQRTAMDRAAKMLGAESVLLTCPDAEIPANDQIAFTVCDLIRKHKPLIVVTHWNGTWHKDHLHCNLIAADAIFYAGLGTCPARARTQRRSAVLCGKLGGPDRLPVRCFPGHQSGIRQVDAGVRHLPHVGWTDRLLPLQRLLR